MLYFDITIIFLESQQIFDIFIFGRNKGGEAR